MNNESYCEHRQKPWGEEIIFTENALPYTGKIIRVKAGCKLSLQYHTEKLETMCLLSGQALLWLADTHGENITKTNMSLEKGYSIEPLSTHRLEAVSDCVFIEVSTPENGTTVRLQDDYNRSDEVIAS